MSDFLTGLLGVFFPAIALADPQLDPWSTGASTIPLHRSLGAGSPRQH